MPTIHRPSWPRDSDGPLWLSVLIVDNHQDAAKSLGEVLRLYNHSVHVVYDSAGDLEAEPFQPASCYTYRTLHASVAFGTSRLASARPDPQREIDMLGRTPEARLTVALSTDLFIPPLSILVVDDQDDVAQSTAELLILNGYSVQVASCGADALREAAVATPDVILLDIGLPGMDGWEVARHMRDQSGGKQPGGKQPFIVVISGLGTEGDRLRSCDAGVDMHLVKPVDPAVLTNLLAKVDASRVKCPDPSVA